MNKNKPNIPTGTSGQVSDGQSWIEPVDVVNVWTIAKEFHFSAAHQLFGLREGHQCANPHGHNYVVRVFLRSSKLNNTGFVRDYEQLDVIKKYIDTEWDHKDLTTHPQFGKVNSSAENMAWFVYHHFKHLLPEMFAVEVEETPKTVARYEQLGVVKLNSAE